MALSRQMINLVWVKLKNQTSYRRGVIEIRIVQKESLAVNGFIGGQVIESLTNRIAIAAYKSMDGVAFA